MLLYAAPMIFLAFIAAISNEITRITFHQFDTIKFWFAARCTIHHSSLCHNIICAHRKLCQVNDHGICCWKQLCSCQADDTSIFYDSFFTVTAPLRRWLYHTYIYKSMVLVGVYDVVCGCFLPFLGSFSCRRLLFGFKISKLSVVLII